MLIYVISYTDATFLFVLCECSWSKQNSVNQLLDGMSNKGCQYIHHGIIFITYIQTLSRYDNNIIVSIRNLKH